MQRKPWLGWIAVAGIAVVAAVATTADDNVWVSDDGHHHYLHAGEHNTFFHEGATEFDVADLADGETRVIGVGDKQITATRSGDEVTLSRPATGDDSALSITCRLSTDTCKVLTFEDDPEKVMIVIKKTRECVDGVGDCDVDVDITALGDIGEDSHARIIVRKTVECDDEGNCTESDDVTEGSFHGHGMVHVESAAGSPGEVVVIEKGGPGQLVFIGESDKAVLSCPEGDTTMRVDREEADDVFLCPKHSVPLEKQKTGHTMRRIEVKKRVPHDDD
jgi:hypothetical protein